MSSTSPLIPIEHPHLYEKRVPLPRTAEQAAWVDPIIVAGCILGIALLALVIVRYTIAKRKRLRTTLTAIAAGVALIAAGGAFTAFGLSQPDYKVVKTKSAADALPDWLRTGGAWDTISDATLHDRIQQQYGIDVPARYLKSITDLTIDQYTGGAKKPVRIIGEDGSAIRECNVWTTRSDPVTIALHCD